MVRSCNSCSKTNRSFSSITLLVFHGMRLFSTQLPKFLQCQGCSRSILSGMCPVCTLVPPHPYPPSPPALFLPLIQLLSFYVLCHFFFLYRFSIFSFFFSFSLSCLYFFLISIFI